MDSLSKILAAISAEAEADAEQIKKEGRKKSDEIKKAYEAEAGIAADAILKKAEGQAEEIRRHRLSQAGIESRNIQLSAKRQALEQAFRLAEKKLTNFPSGEKQHFYENLIKKTAVGRDIAVQLNKYDLADFGEKLQVSDISVGLDPNTGAFSGGLVIKEKNLETDCTFETMVEESKKELEPEIAAMLFS